MIPAENGPETAVREHKGSTLPCTHETVGTVPLEEGARFAGIEPKRLRGQLWQNTQEKGGRQGGPIGCPICGRVYLWSLRQADRADGVTDAR